MQFVRVNVTLEPGDLEHLDRLAAETGKSRSELIREAVRAYRPPAKTGISREEALHLLETVRVAFPVGPVDLVRSMREGRRAW